MTKTTRDGTTGVNEGQTNRAANGEQRSIAIVRDSQCLAMQGVLCVLCQERCMARAIRFRAFLGGFARPEVVPELCDGCGLCASACPARAIKLKHV